MTLPRYVKMGTAEDLLGLDRRTIIKLIQQGHLRGAQLPSRHWILDTASVDGLVEEPEEQAKILDIERRLNAQP